MTWDTFTTLLQPHVPNQTIRPDQRLFEDLGLDSFEMVSVVCEMEKHGAVLDFNQTADLCLVADLFHALGGTDCSPSIQEM